MEISIFLKISVESGNIFSSVQLWNLQSIPWASRRGGVGGDSRW
jgi:hypothetical protein